jgi:8-oxo-dGTP diphosphatase
MKEDNLLSGYKNINLKNFKEYCNNPVLIKVNNSYLLRGTSDHEWNYITLEDESDFEQILDKISQKDEYFVIQDKYVEEYFLSNYEIEWSLRCQKFIYIANQKMKAKTSSEIRNLTLDDARYIYLNSDYQDFTSIDYIKECINKGISIGIEKDSKLIGWILTHDDGALGFLHVIDQYRRMGYARKLLIEAVNLLIEEGKTPYLHIEAKNNKSLGLANSLGFEYLNDILWIKGMKIKN